MTSTTGITPRTAGPTSAAMGISTMTGNPKLASALAARPEPLVEQLPQQHDGRPDDRTDDQTGETADLPAGPQAGLAPLDGGAGTPPGDRRSSMPVLAPPVLESNWNPVRSIACWVWLTNALARTTASAGVAPYPLKSTSVGAFRLAMAEAPSGDAGGGDQLGDHGTGKGGGGNFSPTAALHRLSRLVELAKNRICLLVTPARRGFAVPAGGLPTMTLAS